MRKGLNKSFNKPIYYVFVEGDTEECYFSTIKELFNLRFEVKKKHQIEKTKSKIISRSKKLLESINLTVRDIKSLKIKIYYIIDSDHYTKTEIDCIKTNMKDKYIKVLFSNKDIETFLYSHIDFSNSSSCDYKAEIQKKYLKYEKGNSLKLQEIHKKIINGTGSTGNGIKNLKINMSKLKKYHGISKHIYDMNPYSEVVELIDEFFPSL